MPKMQQVPLRAPKPVWYFLLFVVVPLFIMWIVPAYWVFHAIAEHRYQLLITEATWFTLLAWGLLHGLSWFRIELTTEGVRKHGYFRDKWIAWSNARVSHDGILIKIAGAGETINVNAFVYSDSAQIDEYIAYCIAAAKAN